MNRAERHGTFSLRPDEQESTVPISRAASSLAALAKAVAYPNVSSIKIVTQKGYPSFAIVDLPLLTALRNLAEQHPTQFALAFEEAFARHLEGLSRRQGGGGEEE